MLKPPPGIPKTPLETSLPRRGVPQTAIALVALLALEGLFAAMARLGDLKLHAIETIALALAAGVVYIVALYALELLP